MSRRTGVIACLSALIGTAASWAAPPATRVEKFALAEVKLEAIGSYGNPYRELEAEATLTGPENIKPRQVPLFWDGAATWKFRFAPDQVGAWQWKVKSADRGLDGQTGSLDVVASKRAGSIRPMKDFPHHFARQDGQPLWFLGDTAWALPLDSEQERLDRTAALDYLDARKAQGFNVVHLSLLSEAGWGNQGGPPFDDLAAEKMNVAYWQEVDLRLAHANKLGLVCGLALAWGDKRMVEPYAWRKYPDLTARLRYARYIAARHSAYDVYFLVSGEWHAEVKTRGSSEEEVRREFVEIGDALHAADPHGRMIGIHPMTEHGSVREFTGTKWMSFGDYQQNYSDLHGRVLQSREVGQPVVNSEYGYFLRDQSGDGVPDKDNSTSLTAMRHATWDIAMAGGYVVTGFGTTYFGGNRDPGPFDVKAEKNKPWEEQLGHLKACFARTQWWKLAPHDELLACETPRGRDGREFGRTVPPAATYWCLAEPGRQCLVYFRGLKHPVELKLETTSGPLSVTQFNPRTGQTRELDKARGERYELWAPDEQDWIVLLK